MTLSISFDRVSDIYDSTRGLPPDVSKQVTSCILNLVSATPDTKFFESGIGTGRIALPVVQRGYSYTGVDISEKMLDELRRKIQGVSEQVTLVNADATALPFDDNSFDVALTAHLFHLIPAWRQALAEVRRVLKPDGIYLYSHGRVGRADLDEHDFDQKRFDFDRRWEEILAACGHPITRYGATEQEVLEALSEQAQRWRQLLQPNDKLS